MIILDGTLSTLRDGAETNAGLIFKLLTSESPSARLSVRYEAGVQWPSWRQTGDVITGKGINRQIRRVYGFLASRYRPGDRIFLFGYSRGAFAVRSLAGLIDRIGLLKAKHATERNIQLAYRYYELRPDSDGARAFARRFCDPEVRIEMVGVFDTVKALGIRLPLLWRLTEPRHAFHDHQLGASIRHGYHALALDERRVAFAPVLWTCAPDFAGDVVQMWFRGNHGDIGGQLAGHLAARPLSNIPLTWMLERAEARGLPLPPGWRARYPANIHAPSSGAWTGWGKLFLYRKTRTVGQDRSEAVHPSVLGGQAPPIPPLHPIEPV